MGRIGKRWCISVTRDLFVYIEWVDITSQADPWLDIEEAVKLKPAQMMTCGWIIREDEESIVIASTIDKNEEIVGDVNCIPHRSIDKIIPLEHPG